MKTTGCKVNWQALSLALVIASVPSLFVSAGAQYGGTGQYGGYSGGNNATPQTSASQRPTAQAMGLSGNRTISRKEDPYKNSTVMRDKVSIPNLPEYPGRTKWLNGTKYADINGGPSYDMNMSTMEKPNQVIEWYKQALKGGQWKELSGNDSSVYSESKDGSRVAVAVSTASPTMGAYTLIHVMYHQNHRQ